METFNEREISVYTLIDILSDGGFNNIVLRKNLRRNNAMPKVKKAFVTEVVNGVLRNLIYIDYVINSISNTPTTKMNDFIINNLRISVYQILYLDKVPDFAVCNEAVDLTKKEGYKNLAPFVNGVLRNVIRNSKDIKLPSEKNDKASYMSVKYSIPKWLIDYWSEDLKEEEVLEICKGSIQRPRVTVCINKNKTSKEKLVESFKDEGITVINSEIDDILHIENTSDISKSAAFNEGLFHVIDISSALAVKILDPEPNEIIFDACAAPGGKSFCAAYKMENTGVIYSQDIYEHKLKLIEDTSRRLDITNIKTITPEQVDEIQEVERLLVDAPCSGFGLLLKKPDVKYKKTLGDIKSLAALQREILEKNYKKLKVGGVLVYCTCTISPKENLENIKSFANKHGFEFEDISEYTEVLYHSETAKDGYIQLFPCKNWDGFFIAKLRRVK